MTDTQRIWILSELYYPEITSTGYFVTRVAEGLASKHDVSVLCGQPSYSKRGTFAPTREMHNNVDVTRCRATTLDKNRLVFKIVNLFSVSISISVAALIRIKRKDIVIVVTNPPLMAYIILLVCKLKQSRLVLLVHDVYPEVFLQLGIIRPRSFLARLMDRASCRLYNGASRIIVLGRDMHKLVSAKLDSRRERMVIATNWADIEGIVQQSSSANRLLRELNLEQRFVVQYCGNMGRTHGIKDIIQAAQLLSSEPEYQFLFIGWGAMKQWVIQQKQAQTLYNLTIMDTVPSEGLCDALNACSVAIIAFSKGMKGISVPSRMYNVLASGKPLVAVCDYDSELAQVVREEDIGWVVPPDHPDLIVLALREAKSSPDRLCAMGLRARRAAEKKYAFVNVLPVYENLIEGLNSE